MMMKTSTLGLQKRVFSLLFIIIILFSIYCSRENASPDDRNPASVFQVVILYTNDEHGWLEGTGNYGGAAEMTGLWRQNEGYKEEGPFLILSGGDMWTGPAISTWFKGESMIEAMNGMSYQAAAIGNHEFDFQTAGLNDRLKQAAFPFLAANIRQKSTNESPGFAVHYIVKEVNHVMVGVIGLSALNTPNTAFPDYVQGYDFSAYATALRETVPRMKNAGAELLVVVGHICRSEMVALTAVAAELGIALIGGGHCHETVNEVKNGVTIIEAGSYFKKYARIKIMFNTETDMVESIEPKIQDNLGGAADPEIAAIVSKWRARTDEQLSGVIGYAEREIGRDSAAMANMIADSWLWALPAADISISNAGGVRQSISAGNITMADIVGVLPFENTIIQLELTGAQLINCLDGALFVGGMTTVGGYFLANGTPIGSGTVYKVLITDFIYSAYGCFATFDPEPEITGIHWRQPVIDWIKSLNTSSGNPLDQYLDPVPRMVNSGLQSVITGFEN
jgi:5'-nucleotidase/UDP-sugar diphosphatase